LDWPCEASNGGHGGVGGLRQGCPRQAPKAPKRDPGQCRRQWRNAPRGERPSTREPSDSRRPNGRQRPRDAPDPRNESGTRRRGVAKANDSERQRNPTAFQSGNRHANPLVGDRGGNSRDPPSVRCAPHEDVALSGPRRAQARSQVATISLTQETESVRSRLGDQPGGVTCKATGPEKTDVPARGSWGQGTAKAVIISRGCAAV